MPIPPLPLLGLVPLAGGLLAEALSAKTSSSMKMELDPDIFLRLTGSSLAALTPRQIEKHTQLLKSTGRIEPVWLALVTYDDGSIGVEQHDGRHRSRAAALANIPTISVILEGPADILQRIQSGETTSIWSQPYDDEEIEYEGYLPEELIQMAFPLPDGTENPGWR